MVFDKLAHEHISDFIESGSIVDSAEHEGVTIHTLLDGRVILDPHFTDSILIQ
mgnify:CR=1 FL=1